MERKTLSMREAGKLDAKTDRERSHGGQRRNKPDIALNKENRMTSQSGNQIIKGKAEKSFIYVSCQVRDLEYCL